MYHCGVFFSAMKTLSRTFRVYPETLQQISEFSKEHALNLSQSLRTLVAMARKYERKQQLMKELESLSHDEVFLKESEEWANLQLD